MSENKNGNENSNAAKELQEDIQKAMLGVTKKYESLYLIFEKKIIELDSKLDPNPLTDYCLERFAKEKKYITHTLGSIKKFFGYNPYTMEEKAQAMELLIDYLMHVKNNGSNTSFTLPEKFMNMSNDQFERVIGALGDGRLKKAVVKYCDLKNDSNLSFESIINNLSSPSLRPSNSPSNN